MLKKWIVLNRFSKVSQTACNWIKKMLDKANLRSKFVFNILILLFVFCCGVSIASEQQHKQDLRRIYKREYEFSKSSLFTRMLCAFLPECIAPSTRVHCATNNTRFWHRCAGGLFCVNCGWDRWVVMVCFDLPVKRCERDRAWLSQPLLLSSMQNLKVWKSGRLIVTS